MGFGWTEFVFPTSAFRDNLPPRPDPDREGDAPRPGPESEAQRGTRGLAREADAQRGTRAFGFIVPLATLEDQTPS